MPVSGLASTAAIEIDGNELPAAVANLIAEVVVDDHLYLPDTFEITISNPSRAVLDATGVRIGSRVRVSATALGDPTPVLLIGGEVTALEGEYHASGSALVIRGYDLAHRLARGRRTATYNNVKYSDIAQQLASRASLQAGTIADSTDVHEHVPQVNQSDWEFLQSLAAEIDYRVAVLDDTLDFGPPTSARDAPSGGDYASSDPLQLVFGEDLLEFRGRVTSAGQVGSVQVRGWSPDEKQKVVGTAQAGTTAASLQDDPGSLAALFGDHTFVSIDRGPVTQALADRLAGRFAELIGSTFAEATGIARGNPRLKAGTAVNVSIVDAPFTGRYTLTHTRHVFDLAGGYRTHLTVSGRQDRSLLSLTSAGVGAGA